jgi:hypothetical protein
MSAFGGKADAFCRNEFRHFLHFSSFKNASGVNSGVNNRGILLKTRLARAFLDQFDTALDVSGVELARDIIAKGRSQQIIGASKQAEISADG